MDNICLVDVLGNIFSLLFSLENFNESFSKKTIRSRPREYLTMMFIFFSKGNDHHRVVSVKKWKKRNEYKNPVADIFFLSCGWFIGR